MVLRKQVLPHVILVSEGGWLANFVVPVLLKICGVGGKNGVVLELYLRLNVLHAAAAILPEFTLSLVQTVMLLLLLLKLRYEQYRKHCRGDDVPIEGGVVATSAEAAAAAATAATVEALLHCTSKSLSVAILRKRNNGEHSMSYL